MKLLTLEMVNFRQFYGKQEIEFASGDSSSNITVFHGYNGSGKTALLNAFVWCLYGETTPDLESGEKLENERAVAEAGIGAETRVSVCLRFELRGEKWRVERHKTAVKTGSGSLEPRAGGVILTRTTPNGETELVGATDSVRDQRIEQLLPKSLYPFFFFNGERVERLAGPDAYDSIESGVKTLLDIEIYERGAGHLRGGVTKDLSAELKTLGDDEMKEAIQVLERQEKESDECKAKLSEHEANVRALSDEIEKVERRQAEIAVLSKLTEDRTRLRAEDEDLTAKIVGERKKLAAAVSWSGYLAFALPAMDGTEAQVASARKKGDIPAKIKPQFVDDLVRNEMCICRRPILPGSAEQTALLDWKKATGLADLEEKIFALQGGIGRLRERRSEVFAEVDASLENLTELYKKRASLREQLSVLDDKLGDRTLGEDAAILQSRIKALQRQREHESANVIVETRRKSDLAEALGLTRKSIEKLEQKNAKAAIIQKQFDSVQKVADALEAVATIQKNDVRECLDDQISEVWNDAAIKDYVASVSPTYRLLLTKRVGGQSQAVIGASTGEKQVLALSFVGALVRKARENVGRNQGVETGGLYPLVMDSPFGALEDDYRAKVAHWLPTLAHQVVVMVSKTQWRQEVEAAMRPKIGREYVLVLHTPKANADRTIEINGVNVPYVVSTTDVAEITIIQGV